MEKLWLVDEARSKNACVSNWRELDVAVSKDSHRSDLFPESKLYFLMFTCSNKSRGKEPHLHKYYNKNHQIRY